MYVRGKPRTYTGKNHSVAFGPLRGFYLFPCSGLRPETRTSSDINMANRKVLEKSARLELRLTPADKQAIEERAKERGLTVVEFLTRAGLGRATRQRADVDAINELRSCVDELKGMHHTLKRIADGDKLIAPVSMASLMLAVTEAIQRIWNNGRNQE